MSKIKPFLLLLAFFTVAVLTAQDTISKRIFPEGEPILRVFTNFHAGLSGDDTRSAFELDRAYLGYRMDLGRDFEAKVLLDVGSPDDLSEFSRIRRYAYFKNASLSYNKSWLTIDFGLIDMQHFKLQEQFWGHRYIEKSFADRYKFGPSADLGMDFILNFSSRLKIDFTVSNGEGYTNLQRDDILKLGLGVQSELLKGLFIRLYSDMMTHEVPESAGAAFLGYRFKKLFVVGAEYNWMLNEDYKRGYNRTGYSVYGSYILPYDLEVFARYDFVRSNIPEDADRPWDLANDGSSIIGGLQYQPISRVKIALSYRDWYPYAQNLDNHAYIYLNLEFKY